MFLFFILFNIFSWYIILKYYFKNTLENIRNNYGYYNLTENNNNYMNIIFYLIYINYICCMLILSSLLFEFLSNNIYLNFLTTLNYYNFKIYIIIEILKIIDNNTIPDIYKFICYTLMDYYFMNLANSYSYNLCKIIIFNLIYLFILLN